MDGLTPMFRFGDVSSNFYGVVHTLKTYAAILKMDKLCPANDFFHVYDYQVVQNVSSKTSFLFDEYQNGRSYGVDDYRLDLWSGFSTLAVIFPGLEWANEEVVALLKGLD